MARTAAPSNHRSPNHRTTTVKDQKPDEASTQSLDVYLHGERIGIITRGQDPEGPSFRYLESYRTRPGAIALGRQIPLTEERTRSETILRWIDGLLPEGDRRGDLNRQLGLHRMSTWSLIREIGLSAATIKMRSAELTGAGESVQVRREGKVNHYFHREPCAHPREGVSEASVAARVARMIEQRNCYGPECRDFLIGRRQNPQHRVGEGLRGSALSEESMDACTPLHRDSGGLQLAPAVDLGPQKKGETLNQ